MVRGFCGNHKLELNPYFGKSKEKDSTHVGPNIGTFGAQFHIIVAVYPHIHFSEILPHAVVFLCEYLCVSVHLTTGWPGSVRVWGRDVKVHGRGGHFPVVGVDRPLKAGLSVRAQVGIARGLRPST